MGWVAGTVVGAGRDVRAVAPVDRRASSATEARPQGLSSSLGAIRVTRKLPSSASQVASNGRTVGSGAVLGSAARSGQILPAAKDARLDTEGQGLATDGSVVEPF